VRQRTVRVGQSAMEYEIPEVIPPDLERPNSHDVYLVDYRIWGVMQDLDVTDPRHHLIDTFCETQVRTDGEDELDIFFSFVQR